MITNISNLQALGDVANSGLNDVFNTELDAVSNAGSCSKFDTKMEI